MSDLRKKAQDRLEEIKTLKTDLQVRRATASREASELQKEITKLDGEERSLLNLLDENKQ